MISGLILQCENIVSEEEIALASNLSSSSNIFKGNIP